MSFLRVSGEAGRRVCLTHGRGELRRRREKRRRMALKIFSEHKPYLNFRSARLNGKKMAIKIKITNRKNIQDIVLKKILYIAENKLLVKTSPFFYE